MTDGYYYTASLGGKRIRVAVRYVALVLAVVGFCAGFVTGLLVKTYFIYSKGYIVIVTPPPPPELKLNVYEDENCTVGLTEIDWGTLEPGESKDFLAYVKNLGDVPFTMALSTQSWVPAEAEMYITVSWDYVNQTVSVGEVMPVTFTLKVSSSISDINSFSFDIVITATQA